MGGHRRKPRRDTVHIEVCGVQDRRKKQDKKKNERLAIRNNVKEVEQLYIFGRLREEIGTKTCMHGPMDYAKMLKLRFRVGDLDVPGRRGMPVVGRRRK